MRLYLWALMNFELDTHTSQYVGSITWEDREIIVLQNDLGIGSKWCDLQKYIATI